jgi:hypothetical protein
VDAQPEPRIADEGKSEPPRLNREKLAWSFALLLLVVLVLQWLSWFRSTPQPQQPVRSSLLPPPNATFLPSNFELSPDGSRLAFAAAGPEGSVTLWVRVLSASGAQPFKGTEGARFPFWSPDNR